MMSAISANKLWFFPFTNLSFQLCAANKLNRQEAAE
jgi:hypothetical protein